MSSYNNLSASYICRAMATSALLLLAPAMAQAKPGAGDRILVQTRDLDLTTKDGRRQLDRRLSRAAYRICYTSADRIWDYWQCQREILNGVRPRRDEIVAIQESRKIASSAQ